MAAHWIVERTQNARFPFRISLEQDGRPLLVVRAQNAWPGAGTQVFCLRERESDPDEALEPVERVPVLHVARLGKKLSVTLDRPQRKRCEFLKLERPRRDGQGTYEQIFLRTEAAARAHRTRGRVELVPRHDLDVAIDVGERYPWTFPGARVVRRRLPVGDYAVLAEDRTLAVVERKTLPNLLAEVGEIKGFHQQLAELGSHPHAALVVEAQYGDLADPAKIARWPASHLLRVVAELAALHPRVPLVFAGNRKMANVWTQRYFAAVLAAVAQPLPDLVAAATARYEPPGRDGGLDVLVRSAALHALPDGFASAAVVRHVPDVRIERVRRVLHALRAEGRLRCEGRGPGARWHRVPAPAAAERAEGG